MRNCKKCGCQKPTEDMHTKFKCVECYRKQKRTQAKKDRDRKPGMAADACRKWREQNKETYLHLNRENSKRYRENNPEKIADQNSVWNVRRSESLRQLRESFLREIALANSDMERYEICFSYVDDMRHTTIEVEEILVKYLEG